MTAHMAHLNADPVPQDVPPVASTAMLNPNSLRWLMNGELSEIGSYVGGADKKAEQCIDGES